MKDIAVTAHQQLIENVDHNIPPARIGKQWSEETFEST